MNEPQVTVVMPALNEENNIQAAIRTTLEAFDRYGLRGELLVVNDGSTDRTGEVVSEFQQHDARVQVLRHETPRGIGASFWDGVAQARGEAVLMLPGDNENDPGEILRYHPLLDHVDMVVPYVFTRRKRSLFRRILSRTYLFIIGATFGVSFKYTNGTVMYRKKILEELDRHEPGFFYQTDILVRLAKRGYFYTEVPYRIRQRAGGASKAVSFKALRGVIAGYSRLFWDLYLRRRRPRTEFLAGTQTSVRCAESTEPWQS